MENRKSLETRLNAKTRKSGACFVWTGPKTKGGFGQIAVRGKQAFVHRISYSLRYGVIPKSKVVVQICHNHRCLNPDHLRLGTIDKNKKYVLARTTLPTKQNKKFRFSEADVIRIRKAFKKDLLIREIARRYHVRYLTAWEIATGRSWKHVK